MYRPFICFVGQEYYSEAEARDVCTVIINILQYLHGQSIV